MLRVYPLFFSSAHRAAVHSADLSFDPCAYLCSRVAPCPSSATGQKHKKGQLLGFRVTTCVLHAAPRGNFLHTALLYITNYGYVWLYM